MPAEEPPAAPAIIASVAEFFVLGPLEAIVDGTPIAVQAEKPRALLAVLLLNRNRVVSTSELIDQLWGDDPPETAGSALQVYVSQLRKALGADRVETRPRGYSLRIEDGELDLDRFEALVAERRYKEALALWRGPALAEFRSEAALRQAGERLDDARLDAIELRIDSDLARGRHVRLIPELEELVEREPFRERFRAQLMLALYRSGRQADALEVYRRMRETFVEELGLDPSPELQELEAAILRHDESLRRPAPSVAPEATPAAAPRRSRVALAVAALLAAAVAAGAAAVALSHGGSSSPSDHELRTFVSRLENFLAQSRDGRRAVTAAVDAGFHCRLTPPETAEQLNRVQRNRQSLLQQIAALSVPEDTDARQASDLLQKATQASIAADWHYRDWFRAHKRCGPPDDSPELRDALAADRRATLAKRSFVAEFNPLARRVGERAWTAGEF
jgi:DNA-binding SARP family transcriptional activator